MHCDITTLARLLGEIASGLINPGTKLVVDESLYAFEGDCPVRRYIPRKPHPNGLLSYCMSGYFYVDTFEIPYVLDFEPYSLDNKVGPQDAMMALFSRLRERRPLHRPHLIVDSAFGSFQRLSEIVAAGGHATMSMPANAKPWLWALLDFNCTIDSGRLAFFPKEGFVVSSFKVMTEAGNEHQIKTISSGCELVQTGEEEDIVVQVRDRREDSDGNLQYLTEFLDGHTDWLMGRDFIDDDGKTNLAWLSFVNGDDLQATFRSYTHQQLKVLRSSVISSAMSHPPIGYVCFSRLEIDRRQEPRFETSRKEAQFAPERSPRRGSAPREQAWRSDPRKWLFIAAAPLLHEQLPRPRSLRSIVV